MSKVTGSIRSRWLPAMIAAALAVAVGVYATDLVVVINPSRTLVWTGKASSSWLDPGNWSPAATPTSTDSVVIQAGTPNQPMLMGPSAAALLTVQSGATLNLNGEMLTLYGAGVSTNAGTILAGAKSGGTAGLFGSLILLGGYTQLPTGTLTVSQGAVTTAPVAVSAQDMAVLDGTLALPLLPGYTPTPSNSFPVVAAAGGVSGKFAGLTGANPTPSLVFDPSYLSTAVVVTALDVAAVQPDLEAKPSSAPDTAYVGGAIFQATPGPEQTGSRRTVVSEALVGNIRVSNAGVLSHSFVVWASQSPEPGWTLQFTTPSGDITSQITSPAGYTTAVLPAGGSEVITVRALPGATVAEGTSKSLAFGAAVNRWDSVTRDSWKVVASVVRPDMVIKAAADSDSTYAEPDVFQATPSGGQIKSLTAAPTAPASFQAGVRNRTPLDHPELLRVVESPETGWSVTYKAADGTDISAALRSTGYKVSLPPGGVVPVTVTMTPDGTVAAGATKSADIRVFLDELDTTVRDVVRAQATAAPPSRLAFVQAPSSATAGAQMLPVQVAVQDQFGNKVPGATNPVTIALASAPGTGKLSGTLTAAAVDGVATFSDLSIDEAGSGYTLSASGAGLVTATSAPFDVVAAGGPRLVFSVQPATTNANTTLPPVDVQVQDTAGRVVTSFTGAVTLALAPGSAGGALLGTTTVNARSGVATFSTLKMQDEGTGILLAASAAGLASVTSAPFDSIAVYQPDLLVKTETETAYTGGGLLEDTPSTPQTRALTAAPGRTAVCLVKVLNSGNTRRSFVVRAQGTTPAGWHVTYLSGTYDFTGAITGTAGYATMPLGPGESEVLSVRMSPDNTAAAGSIALTTLRVYLKAADTASRDAVQVQTQCYAGQAQGQLLLPPGATLPEGTIIEIRDSSDKVVGTVNVNPDGTYSISVPPGVYDLVLRAPGYVPLRKTGVDLSDRARSSSRALLQNLDLTLIPQPNLGTGLRLIALPFHFRHAAVETVLADPNAVLYAYDATSGHYRIAGDPGFPMMSPSAGYWMRQRRTSPYTIEEPAEVPAQDQAQTLALAKGWQIVGIPFVSGDLPLSQVQVLLPGATDPIPFGDEESETTVSRYFWGWTGTSYQLVSDLVEGSATTLKPYQGYWVRTLVGGAQLQFLPASKSRAAAPAGKGRAAGGGWSARIVARCGDVADTDNFFGVGRSRAWIEGPPAPTGYVDVRFVGTGDSRAAVDIRAADAARQTWSFEVATDQEGQEVTLTWPGLGQVPRDTRLVLVDEQTGQRRQMRSTPSVTFTAGSTPRRYRIEAEQAAGALIAVTGIEVTPARGGRSIAYTLSAGAAATVSIVSPSGRTLRVVTDRQTASSGRNQVMWDGRDARGVMLSSGLVLVQVTATTEDGATATAVRPVMLVR